MTVADVLQNLVDMGFMDLFIPFILIYTILFAVLQNINIFGKESKKFNAVIALAMSLAVVVPHVLGTYPSGTDVIDIINNSLPGVSLWLVLIVCIMLLIGLVNPGLIKFATGSFAKGITAFAVIVVLYIFGSSANWWTAYGTFSFLNDSDLQALIVVIAMFWIVIAFVTGDKKDKEKEEDKKKKERNWRNELLGLPKED